MGLRVHQSASLSESNEGSPLALIPDTIREGFTVGSEPALLNLHLGTVVGKPPARMGDDGVVAFYGGIERLRIHQLERRGNVAGPGQLEVGALDLAGGVDPIEHEPHPFGGRCDSVGSFSWRRCVLIEAPLWNQYPRPFE